MVKFLDIVAQLGLLGQKACSRTTVLVSIGQELLYCNLSVSPVP